MHASEVLTSMVLELRRGTLVLCVLARLFRPTYGYSLIAQLASSGIAVEANTLYPLLRRLESQRLLISEWETDSAKPRKYYQITPEGREIFNALHEHWTHMTHSVNNILEDSHE